MTRGVQARSTRRKRFAPQMILGIVFCSLIGATTLLSLFWTPYAPGAMDVANRLQPPSAEHWFGTDNLGRDLLSQVMVGGQNSLLVAFTTTIIGVVLGTALGVLAAGSGERWGSLLTRATDLGLALPSVLIALILATTVGPGNLSSIVAISVWFVPVTARVVVGPARQVFALDFIEAAATHGRSRAYILVRHVLPQLVPIIIVQASMMFAASIIIEASLAFLGVGAQPPLVSWGRILNEAQPLLQLAPHFTLLPGLFIVIAILGFNLLGDGLRDILDPKRSTVGGH